MCHWQPVDAHARLVDRSSQCRKVQLPGNESCWRLGRAAVKDVSRVKGHTSVSFLASANERFDSSLLGRLSSFWNRNVHAAALVDKRSRDVKRGDCFVAVMWYGSWGVDNGDSGRFEHLGWLRGVQCDHTARGAPGASIRSQSERAGLWHRLGSRWVEIRSRCLAWARRRGRCF